MKHSVVAALLVIALCLLAGAVQAQTAYTTTSAQLRAGPGFDYPVVAILPPGSQVSVQGCVEDYSWCDVVVGSERGWIDSGSVQSYYNNASDYVPLYYGAALGIAAYPFFINDYWGRYYYNRPWYPQLNWWANHHNHHPPGHGHPMPVGRPPSRSGFGAAGPHPHGPGRGLGQPHATGGMPVQPHAPGGMPVQPHVPGVVPGQPRGPGPGQRGAPIVVPRQPYTIGMTRQPPVAGGPAGSGLRSGSGAPVHGAGRGVTPSGGGRGMAPSGGGGHGGHGR